MKLTFRWYGEKDDSIPLRYIRQIPGCTGIMGVLNDKAAGEVWTLEECRNYVDGVHSAGLECEVIESVNVHEDIKLGLPDRDFYIDHYIRTIRNLAAVGVKVIIYNFMPVLDWLRTDLARVIPEDGSNSLYFDEQELGTMTPMDIVKKTEENSNGFTLPGWEPERLADLEHVMEEYQSVTSEDLLNNFAYFMNAVAPVCEKTGVKMACHPDDPGWPIFGLPRISHDLQGFERMMQACDSPANTICFCTGSLGSNVENDIPAMIRHFGAEHRISCLHVRNIRHLGSNRKFRESAHLSAAGDLDMYEIMKAVYETCPEAYIRPDHGRMIWDEKGRPGYGLYDRALGLTYLSGLWEAIVKSEKTSRA